MNLRRYQVNWSAVAAGITVACAIVVTSLVIRREVTGVTSILRARRLSDYMPKAVPDWGALVASGHRMGPSSASFVIVAFADFQCPACREFALNTVAPLRSKHPNDIALVHRDWPLPYHQHAYAAARAAGCAGFQGHFERMHDRLYKLQDSIGFKPFGEFASEAGVPDSVQFALCLANPDSSAALSDARTARALGGRGTPTVLVNGNLLDGVPDSASLDAIFQNHIRGLRR